MIAGIHTDSFGWGYAVAAVVILLWLGSVVWIAKENTEDPFDRIVWLMIVLTLNFVGTVLYLVFAENETGKVESKAQTPRSTRKTGFDPSKTWSGMAKMDAGDRPAPREGDGTLG